MFAVAAYSTVAAALQVTVPSYGLRLVRRFGTHRVGWFLVAAFVSLALLHIVQPIKPMTPRYSANLSAELVYAVTSVLLLIGMGHLESRFSEQEQSRSKQEHLRAKWELSLEEKNLELAEAHAALLCELEWREKNEKALAESEADYHFLFDENPQPMWIYDLETGHILAVNYAALRQYGFTPGEQEAFMALKVQDLWPADALLKCSPAASSPTTEPRPLGWWQHRRKDGSPIDVEVVALDLTYAGFDARLILTNDIRPRWRHAVTFHKPTKNRTTT